MNRGDRQHHERVAERHYAARFANGEVWRVQIASYGDAAHCVFWRAPGDDVFTGDCCEYPSLAAALGEVASDAEVYRGSALVSLVDWADEP